MSDSGVFEMLRTFFIYVGYPVVIIAAFVVVAIRMRALFMEYEAHPMVQWRLAVAGLLPVVVLTFVVVGEFPEAIPWLPLVDRWELQLPIGALLAIGTMEASQHVSGTRQALWFMLYLSTLAIGLLYVVMEGELARFQSAVFAIVVAGGLHFVFREPDASDADRAQPAGDGREDEPTPEPFEEGDPSGRFAGLRRIEMLVGGKTERR